MREGRIMMITEERHEFANQHALMAFMRYLRFEEKLNYERIVTDVTLIKNGKSDTYESVMVHLNTNESYNTWGERHN